MHLSFQVLGFLCILLYTFGTSIIEFVLTALTEFLTYKEPPPPKLVLYWNPASNIKAASERLFRNCAVDRCILSDNRTLINQADAVIFDGKETQHLPPKNIGQVWIFSTMEAPVYDHRYISQWKNVFNWTFSYRRDSDILAMYGGMTPKEENNKDTYFNTLLHHKTKDIAWMVSHCKTISRREKYVADLRQLRTVDIYGACGQLQCPRFGSNNDCNRRLLNGTYKFYLAFENTLCRDYATEKIFRTMEYDIVPVIRGGYNITMYLPNHSFIDANINDPSALHKLLGEIGDSDQYYAKFFNWRQHFISKNTIPYGWCEICARLHDLSGHYRLYNDIWQWWRGGPGAPPVCVNPKTAY